MKNRLLSISKNFNIIGKEILTKPAFNMAEVKSVESQQRCTWATSAADLYAAACASALVSPWVAVIDK